MNESETWLSANESGNYEQKKPSHVRRLNFGQSILTLHVVKQFQGQKDGALSLDRDVATIPCTSKGEFVRKWIETHGHLTQPDSDQSLSTSPILGLAANKRTVRSPILCERRKRAKRKDGSRDKILAVAEQQIRSTDQNASRSSCNERKENVRRKLFRSESTVDRFIESSSAVSPVLGGRHSFRGTKKKRSDDDRLERKALRRIENENRENLYNTSTSPIISKNSSYYQLKRRRPNETTIPSQQEVRDPRGNLICSQKQRALVSKLEYGLREEGTQQIPQRSMDKRKEDTKISDDSAGSELSESKKRFNIEESPEDTERIEIEAESVHRNSDGENKSEVEMEDIAVPSSSSSNSGSSNDQDHSSIRIEDEDTQEPNSIPLIRGDKASCPHSFSVAFGSTSSQTSDKDSDLTFCSRAERIRCAFTVAKHPSQQISQISSQANVPGINESTQTGIISAEDSSLQRTRSDLPTRLAVLESTKKRKKPKKGSLSEKLRSMINRQGSFLRIWKHHFKQTTEKNVTLPCVTIRAQKCVLSFGRQFLEGVATEDPFNLLPPIDSIGVPRLVNVMTIPEIVNMIEARFPSILRIFPPWDILDNKELMLNVTYIKVENNNETIIRDEENEAGETRIERLIVQEFDCLCIRTGELNPSCSDRLNKPDVIAKLFDVDE